ncbi:hypothetical protein KP509_14G018200 [Ceratopteris richardii]|uniref:NADP-dependent oxidoreductase domain-containing protein n=2 Tax=Ceratopteris richardii TaxID=49495 RepID=A0A8T2TB18_CERRI|nr:hypothetical protein KP509_14G018200 [Ceratopteris richardii]KAH7414923.1 hypothetical protein KP509_14G018200 [Ceratopteris richardii]
MALQTILRGRNSLRWLCSCNEKKPGITVAVKDVQQRKGHAGFCLTDINDSEGWRAFSSVAAAAASSSSHYITGHATTEGTANFAKKIGANAGAGHFRTLRAGGAVGDLIVSSLGIGTYMGPDSDSVDREYMESITRSLSLGVNVIDCAANYRNMRSELLIGQVLPMAIKQGIINRNEVVVCSKAGYLAFDYREDIDPYTYIDETYIKTELFKREEFVGGCHCLSPAYLKNQLELSRRNMGLETIDIYFIHNPETQLSAVPRSTVLSRIKGAIAAMEECCAEGKIAMYGIATWNGFRVNASNKQHLPLEEILSYAKDIGGENHRFKVVQAPYNSFLHQAATEPSQPVRGRRMPLLHAAHHLGLSVITSATINQGNLSKNLNPDVRNKSPELGEQRTDAQAAIQFARTTPGIVTNLLGMRKVMHVEENCAVIRYPAHPRS